MAETLTEVRLDRAVADTFPSAPLSQIREAIANGCILVNGRPVRKGLRVRSGDTIRITELMESSDIRVYPNSAVPLDVVWEDAQILALNKAAGMPVHPLDPREMDTLANGLIARYPELAGIGDDPLFPAILHRIDTGTSGLVLAARTQAAYDALREQFRTQTVKKEYVALAHGRVTRAGTLEDFLAHQPARPGKMMVLSDETDSHKKLRPMRAVTAFRPARVCGDFTLLDVTIFTGVTHQIRCQLANIGHPLVGDEFYGAPREPRLPNRHFLHALAATYEHPGTGTRVRHTAALPPDLNEFLALCG